MLKQIIKLISKLLGLFFLCLASFLVYKEVHRIGWHQVENQITQLPISICLFALLFVLLDYFALSLYDFLGLEYIGKKLKKWLVFKTAFISFSITNTTGHAYIAGGSIRYLFYSKAGLSEFQVLKVIAFESLTFLMGMAVVLNVCLILSHLVHMPALKSYQHLLDIGAIVVSLMFVLYIAFVVLKKRHFKWKNIQINVPSLSLTIKQMLVGAGDILSASFVFYILFSAHLNAPYLYVAVIFLISQLIGISTQVPGGLGVFEASFLYLYPHSSDEKLSLLATLISFRVLYYFLPFFISCLYLIINAFWQMFIKKE